MEFDLTPGQRCNFRIAAASARLVKLVLEFPSGTSQIYSLNRLRGHLWDLTLTLPPGEYRYCYHVYDGRSLNYLTPPAAQLDGLKAICHVGSQPASHSVTDGATINRTPQTRAAAPTPTARPAASPHRKRLWSTTPTT